MILADERICWYVVDIFKTFKPILANKINVFLVFFFGRRKVSEMEHSSLECGVCEPCCHVYVSVEKILVHEWARFRWGVFNEYPDAGEPGFYFSTITGHVEPIRCALSINGLLFNTSTARSYCAADVTDPTTGLFPEECEFRAYPGGPSQSVCKASIMDRPTIQPVSVIEHFSFSRKEVRDKYFA